MQTLLVDGQQFLPSILTNLLTVQLQSTVQEDKVRIPYFYLDYLEDD